MVFLFFSNLTSQTSLEFSVTPYAMTKDSKNMTTSLKKNYERKSLLTIIKYQIIKVSIEKRQVFLYSNISINS